MFIELQFKIDLFKHMMIVCVFVIELLMVYTLFECIPQFYFFAVDVG